MGIAAGSYENWRPDRGAIPASVLGRTNGWAGERWLDIRRLDVLAPRRMARSLSLIVTALRTMVRLEEERWLSKQHSPSGGKRSSLLGCITNTSSLH